MLETEIKPSEDGVQLPTGRGHLSRAHNSLTLCSVPVLIHTQVWVHILGDPQCSAEERYNNSRDCKTLVYVTHFYKLCSLVILLYVSVSHFLPMFNKNVLFKPTTA